VGFLVFILNYSNDMGSSLTFFYQNNNAGACGKVHQDTDYICALRQYGFKFDPSVKLMTDK
jgi:hypothetical protein